jgi:hypothetical protein
VVVGWWWWAGGGGAGAGGGGGAGGLVVVVLVGWWWCCWWAGGGAGGLVVVLVVVVVVLGGLVLVGWWWCLVGWCWCWWWCGVVWWCIHFTTGAACRAGAYIKRGCVSSFPPVPPVPPVLPGCRCGRRCCRAAGAGGGVLYRADVYKSRFWPVCAAFLKHVAVFCASLQNTRRRVDKIHAAVLSCNHTERNTATPAANK